MNKIILASKSPRRKQLLEWAEVPFEIVVKDTEEWFPPGLTPEEVAVYIAKAKAVAVRSELKGDEIILAADTIVVIGDNIIGKPVHREDAVSMLLALSGEKHLVITGVVIMKGDKEIAFADTTEVEFHDLTEEQIEFYVDNYKPYDKAGSYGAQESLPAGMNPCSKEEIEFLSSIKKLDIIEKSIQNSVPEKGIALIDKINGSYFNVMGLPIKELYEELIKF